MPALTPEERGDLEAQHRDLRARDQERYEELRRHAQAVYRAVEWHPVDSPEAWADTCQKAHTDYQSGFFLMERLGAERLLDPALMATLWGLRQALLADLAAATTAERMLVDMTVLAYHNALRVQGWIGSLALWTEHELFGQPAPAIKLRDQVGPGVEGRAVEERLKRLGEVLLPLLDRSNRMVVRNLKAIKELRQGPMPTVSVGQAGQVNVASQQVNAVDS